VRRQRQVSVTRVIPADRAVIFEVIADPSQHPVIDGSGSVSAVRSGGPARLELGTRFGMEMSMGASYRIENEVVEFDAGERIAWRHFGGHRWRYELTDVDGGTQVTETFDWSRSRSRLALELARFPKRNRRAMERTLERLEALVVDGEVAGADG
jgi:uncharacterized protein YndB with AHSA1/START domain